MPFGGGASGAARHHRRSRSLVVDLVGRKNHHHHRRSSTCARDREQNHRPLGSRQAEHSSTEDGATDLASRSLSSPDVAALSVDELLIMAEEGLLIDDEDGASSDSYAAAVVDGEGRCGSDRCDVAVDDCQHNRTASIESLQSGGRDGSGGVGHRATFSLSSIHASPSGTPERQLARQTEVDTPGPDHNQSHQRYAILDSAAAPAASPASTVEASLAPPAGATPLAETRGIPNGGSAAPTPAISNISTALAATDHQRQPRTPSPTTATGGGGSQRRTRSRAKTKLATNAGLGFKHGLRRTGRLFRGKRRRLSRGAATDDADDVDEACVDEDGPEMDGRGIAPTLNGDGRMLSGRRISGASPPLSARRTSSARGLGILTHNSIRSAGGTESEWDETTAIVRGVESTLRFVLIVLGAFMLGAAKPEFVAVVKKAAELGCAAWLTCALILVLSAFRGGVRDASDDEGEYVPIAEEEEMRTVAASPIDSVYHHVEAR